MYNLSKVAWRLRGLTKFLALFVIDGRKEQCAGRSYSFLIRRARFIELSLNKRLNTSILSLVAIDIATFSDSKSR